MQQAGLQGCGLLRDKAFAFRIGFTKRPSCGPVASPSLPNSTFPSFPVEMLEVERAMKHAIGAGRG